jgi:geranylgeranyl pyrophosphate synthase
VSIQAVALGAETAELVRAGGAHVPPLMARIEDRLRAAADGHGVMLAEHGGSTIAAGGKRLRPLLVLLAAGPPAGAAQADALVRAGAAVELVHSATLVHDDVLDAASLRRGRPTVVATAGAAMAIATGDLLFAQAFAGLTEPPAVGGPDPSAAVRTLSDACSALARGELAQRADAWDAHVSVERYLYRCELKTARLFEAACLLGALAVGEAAGGLGRFGRGIGLAFQLLDDVLDVAGPAERTGKHRGTDLLDGTVTLPFIVARERSPELAALDPRTVTTPQDAERVCDAIAATGALDDARAMALELVADAKRELPADLDVNRRAALELVADGVVKRYS